MLNEEIIKKYLHVNPRLQELEDDLNEEAQRHIMENEKDDSGMPISLHDAGILALKLDGDKFVLRITHAMPRWVASDLVHECWDYKKYAYLVFDIILDGVEIVDISDGFFDETPFTFGLMYREILNGHDELVYVLFATDHDDSEPEDITLKFKSYRYKIYGEMTKKEDYNMMKENEKSPHPLCVI